MQKARLLFSGKSSFAIPCFPLNAVFFNIFSQKHYVLGGFPQEKGLLLNFRFATAPGASGIIRVIPSSSQPETLVSLV